VTTLLLGIALVLLACLLIPRVGASIEELFEDLW
jgi:hypothetical protein